MEQMKSSLNYRICGNQESSESLLFIHGSGCNGQFLKYLADEFREYKCYLIDLPDHGKSPDMHITSVDEYIDAAAEFAAGLENVTLIGHSLGGTICLGIAAKNLPSVKRSVIISSAAKFDAFAQEIHDMVRSNKVNWPYLLKCLGSLTNLRVLKTLTTMEDASVLLKDFKIDIELDIWDRIPSIQSPVLLLVGARDILTIPECSYKLKDAILRSKVIVFKGYRHMLPIAAKKKVSAVIKKFIQKVQ